MKFAAAFWRKWRWHAWVCLAAGLVVGLYLLASAWLYRPGFPLDDAWIHQTYARSLGQSGEWSFFPGQPTAGSTAPLWTVLLALGYALGVEPLVWAFFLGWVALSGLGLVGMSVFRAYAPEKAGNAFWAGLLLVLEWHMVWAAASGMETLSFAVVVTAALGWLALGMRPRPLAWLGLGGLVGVGTWLRPDAITLLGPVLLVGAFGRQAGFTRARLLGWFFLGFGALFLPYLVFNQALAGAWWPNTFFAKQAEYAVLREQPLFVRLVQQAGLPLVGVGALLLPGFLNTTYQSWRRKNWPVLASIFWVLGYLGLYAIRLPVTYQHGRYIMPVIPVFLLLALAGLAAWARPNSRTVWRRILSRAWSLAVGAALLVFCGLGGQAYARDVAYIESEMVETARWIAATSAPQTLVAAHDIGALGYFGKRPIVDLAGLILPDVIPFIRDEPKLEAYLDQRKPKYLVTLAGWYPYLEKDRRVVFSTQAPFAPAQGGTNMTVYQWQKPVVP